MANNWLFKVVKPRPYLCEQTTDNSPSRLLVFLGNKFDLQLAVNTTEFNCRHAVLILSGQRNAIKHSCGFATRMRDLLQTRATITEMNKIINWVKNPPLQM